MLWLWWRAGYNENVACKLESRKAGLAARVELLVPDYYEEEEAPLASPQSTVAAAPPPFVFRGRQFLFHRPHLRKSTFAVLLLLLQSAFILELKCSLTPKVEFKLRSYWNYQPSEIQEFPDYLGLLCLNHGLGFFKVKEEREMTWGELVASALVWPSWLAEVKVLLIEDWLEDHFYYPFKTVLVTRSWCFYVLNYWQNLKLQRLSSGVLLKWHLQPLWNLCLHQPQASSRKDLETQWSSCRVGHQRWWVASLREKTSRTSYCKLRRRMTCYQDVCLRMITAIFCILAAFIGSEPNTGVNAQMGG